MIKNGNGKKNERDRKNDKKNSAGLKTQTKHGIIAVIFLVLALFFLMSYVGVAGKAGIFIYDIFKMLLGTIGYFLLPTLFILLGYSFIKSEVPDIGWTRAISGVLFLLSGLGIINIAGSAGNLSIVSGRAGGLFGEILSMPFVSLFDTYASLVLLGALLIISILMMLDAKPNLAPFFTKIWSFIKKVIGYRGKVVEEKLPENEEEINPSSFLPEGEEESEAASDKIKKVLGVGKNKKENEENFEPKLKTKTYNLWPNA